jgi:5-methylcytosine-specific restriction enzyme subunit McrC
VFWNATESSITWLSGFQRDLIPSYLADKVRFVVKGSATGIEIGNIIGSVILNNGDTLHIKPKVGEINFFRMLLVCEGLRAELNHDYQEFIGYQENSDASLPALIARRFLYELHYVLKASLRFERTKLIQEQQFVQGKILPVPTLKNIRKRRAFPVATVVAVRDFDTAEHRILAEAAKYALSYVNINTSNKNPHIVSARYWIKRFSGSLRLIQDLAEVNCNLRKSKYAGVRGYYVRTLTLAKVILGQSGFTQGKAEEIYGDVILINSATLFEEYIRNIIAEKYHPQGFSVRKGGNPTEFLYVDGSYKLTPDIAIFKGVNQVLVGDAKYKIPDAKDHYQILSYMRSYGLTTGVLFAPSFSEKEEVISERKTQQGEKVIEMYLPLSNLDTTETLLGQLHEYVHFGI